MSDYSIYKSAFPDSVFQLNGLTSDEVAARLRAEDSVQAPEGPTTRDLVRKYVLTKFNLGLLSLIVLQLLFQKPWDVLISTLLMLVGISINVG